MLKTLYAKLVAVLVLLLGVMAALYIVVTLYSTRMYLQEVEQKFNRNLAENLIAGKDLMRAGRVNDEALQQIFHMYMVINPNIEIYLLDPDGAIVAFSAPPGKVQRQHVSLEPIHQLLSAAPSLPILGDDPRDPHGRKVFSVAPIVADSGTQGYLYVVLGGQEYESVAQLLQSSYVLRLSAWAGIASLLFALVAGVAFFNLLTRRLTRLSAAMKVFDDSELDRQDVFRDVDVSTQDEVGRLGATFKQMADRIVAQMRVLRQTDALRRELVANVSHDLRTPIASLHGYLETLLLKDGQLSRQEQRQYLEIALKHSTRLATLVAELFELAKLDAEDINLQREPLALGELVQDVILKSQLAAHDAGVTLQSDIPEQLPLVSADIGMIERVLDNLIDNALHHTQRGGMVKLSLSRHPGRVEVRVADSGCGITQADMHRIFDRFYRGERTGSDKANGAGLGLAIAKRILDLHESTISVESELGIGTTFSFSLPATRAD
jgi:two-component system, OmpR family, sensor kinase